MKEAKWTKGPWTCHPEDLRGGRFWCVKGPAEVEIHEDDNGEADAHLIASAPDLAEALEPVAALADLFDSGNYADDDVLFINRRKSLTVGDVRRARSALSRARGET